MSASCGRSWPVCRPLSHPFQCCDNRPCRSPDASPALLLFAESDRITGYANHLVDRVLTLRLTVVARGDDAFDQADRAMVDAHSALMPDATLGGLALLLHEVDAEWDAEDADAGAVALPARYEIRYRTHAMDLTQKG